MAARQGLKVRNYRHSASSDATGANDLG
jgi:hypothetical protein